MKKLISCLIVFVVGVMVYGQTNINELRADLDSLSKTKNGLNEAVEINISELPLSNFLSTIAEEHNLNVSVESGLNQPIYNNFYDAPVKEVFLFLTKEYDLHVEVSGSIISFRKRKVEPVKKMPYERKKLDVNYNKENKFLSVKLKSDTLLHVVEEITSATGRNVGVTESVRNKRVSAFFLNRPFDEVLDMLCKSNNLKYTKDESDFYLIDENREIVKKNSRGNTSRNNNSNLSVKKTGEGLVSIHSNNVAIADIIKECATQLDEYFVMYDVPEGKANLSLNDIGFEDLLKQLLNGTNYTYKGHDDYYLIGNRSQEGLRSTQVIKMEFRTIETVLKLIPQDLNKDVEIKEYKELNAFIVSGSYLKIQELKEFLKSIDEVVPMVQIDVIIVYTKKGNEVETGVKGQIGDAPAESSGTVYPGVDVNLNADAINGLLNSINGLGTFNLGQVASNFFMNLKALETNSKIDITQTPKIATLNGHEAKVDIGETTSYQENRVSVNNGINSTVVNNTVWKEQEAKLSLTITPTVSTDEHVTLDIVVDQNDFGGQPAPGAPLNTSTKHFESLVRVKSGEMILMGGLEKNSKSDIGEGTPVLSRIPIIKWFFSSRKKNKEKLKTHVFIRPVVTY